MGVVCVFCGKKGSIGVSYHKFPPYTGLRKVWLKNMGFDQNFEIKSNSRLCSDHFEENCFSRDVIGRERIYSESVPTKFEICCLKCICCNNVKKQGSEVNFCKFHLKNTNLLKLWIENIGMEGFCPNERTVICDAHFEKYCFYNRKDGRLILKSTAFPTLFSTDPLNDSTDRCEDEELDKSTSMEKLFENNNEVSEALTDKNLCSLEDMQNPHYVKSDSQSTLIPDGEKSPETPSTREKNFNHDHHYHCTPRSIRKKYNEVRQRLQRNMSRSKKQKHVIKRLLKEVSTLGEIVKELRNTRVVSESELACLDSISENGVPQLKTRFLNDHNSVKRESLTKKRVFKRQRHQNRNRSCRAKSIRLR